MTATILPFRPKTTVPAQDPIPSNAAPATLSDQDSTSKDELVATMARLESSLATQRLVISEWRTKIQELATAARKIHEGLTDFQQKMEVVDHGVGMLHQQATKLERMV